MPPGDARAKTPREPDVVDAAGAFDVADDDSLRRDLPQYDLPQYDLPQYDLPQYDLLRA